jgi:cobalamin biosynthesis protein CobD/CbiB
VTGKNSWPMASSINQLEVPMPKPSKVFAWGVLILLYLLLTVLMLGNVVPVMLREADTVQNVLAVVAIACWSFITYCFVEFIRKCKPKPKKGRKR